MISVNEAWAILAATPSLRDTETCTLADAVGRILAEPVIAKRTQPPRHMSAMDGYAVAFKDIENGVSSFSVIGEAPAGGTFERSVNSGEAVRIFTGGVVPEGADHIIIQEDTARDGNTFTLTDAQSKPRHIRKRGQDFTEGETLLPAGHRVKLNDLGLIANGNHDTLRVLRRPRLAFIASGDELVPPGQNMTDTQIPNSNGVALAPLVESWGAQCVANVLVQDDKALFTAAIKDLPPVDIIVPIGGASVGDYDYAKDVFYALGYLPEFEKIAVKPGKPCWFAKGENLVLGLPGNPSSAMVTAALFLRPLIDRLAGAPIENHISHGRMGHALPANGARENYLRGVFHINEDGMVLVSTGDKQDSGLTKTYAHASCLVQRLPHAEAMDEGATVCFIPLSG